MVTVYANMDSSTPAYLTFFAVIIILYFLFWKRSPIFMKRGNGDYRSYRPDVMIVLGGGGHTWEMLSTFKKLESQNYRPIYILSEYDQHSSLEVLDFEQKYLRNFYIERVTSPKKPGQEILFLRIFLKGLKSFRESITLLRKYDPEYLIGNGPSLCVPLFLASKLTNLIGWTRTSIIHVESAARVTTVSHTFKILKPFIDYSFAFWPDLLKINGVQPLINNISSKPFIINSNSTKSGLKAFVTVGSSRFPELIKLSTSAEFQHLLQRCGYTSITIQFGNIEAEPELHNHILKVQTVRMLHPVGFRKLMKESDLIITHGGAGTILQALEFGKSIVVVPNPAVKENHQWDLPHKLQSENKSISVIPVDQVQAFLENKLGEFSSNSHSLKLSYELSEEFKNILKLTELDASPATEPNSRELISIIIPCTKTDFEIFKLLLRSLEHFLHWESIHEIFVVVPLNDFLCFKSWIKTYPNSEKINVIPETNWIPFVSLENCNSFPKNKSGWFKQQLVKLSASYFVSTEFYLILDADCILTKDLSSSDLIHKTKSGPRALLQTEDTYKHPNWWLGSARLLGLSPFDTEEIMNGSTIGIGVTPQILSSTIVRTLCAYIEKSHNGLPWHSILSTNRIHIDSNCNPIFWTEYTLYYLFAWKTGLLNKFHVCQSNALADYDSCIWESGHAESKSKIVQNAPNGFFTIFQSNLKIGHEIPSALQKFYENHTEKLNGNHYNNLTNNNLNTSNNYISKYNRRKRNVYIISSELETYPAVGGINTFLRILLSELTHDEDVAVGTHFIFCGLKCGAFEYEKIQNTIPFGSNCSFKLFATEGSKQAKDVKTYFEQFHGGSAVVSDLEKFGAQVFDWIINCDGQEGDICITTIPYECDTNAIENLINKGIRLIHTVHSLVPVKLIQSARGISYDRLTFKERLGHFFLLRFWGLDEICLSKMFSSKYFQKILPKIVYKSMMKEATLVQYASRILVPSTKLAKLTAKLYPNSRSKIFTLPWGFPSNGSIIGDEDLQPHQLKSLPDETSNNRINLLALCKISAQKGIDVLIGAMEYIEATDRSLAVKLCLNICGDMSYQKDDEYFQSIKNRVQCLERIQVIFKGWVTGFQKNKVLNDAHFYLSTSLTEPFGFSLLEAMKFGIPIIAFAVEGPSDIVSRDCGELVSSSDCAAQMERNFASAISHCCYNRNYKTMSTAARQAASKFKIKKLIKNITRCY